jgi:hypothetical protein
LPIGSWPDAKSDSFLASGLLPLDRTQKATKIRWIDGGC